MHENMKKVSVIIPVYNVEKYLPACLDSVLGQSLQELECICIDDASPDSCGDILDEYAAKDERIRVLHLTENHMQGYGRNRGLEMAEGKYVYFLDSDDMITSNAMEELYQLAERDELDGIYFDSQILLETEDLARFAESYICVRKGDYPDEVFTGRELMELFMKNGEWMVYVQRQFWRRDFLLENEVFSPEKTEHEDDLFSYMAALLAKRVRYVRKDYFIRRYRSNSVMTRPLHPKDFAGYFRIFIKMIEFADKHQISGTGVDGGIYKIFTLMINHLDVFDTEADPADWFTPEEQKDYRLFRVFLESYKRLNSYDMILWAPLASYETIWLYGAGRFARRTYSRLQKRNIRVGGFFVTSAEGNPERLFGLPVIPIETVDSLAEGDVVVVAMASNMHIGPEEILKQKGFPYFLFFNDDLKGPMGPQSETE